MQCPMPPETTPSVNVAIIGGGFSGTMVAVHLLRDAPAGTTIHLIERRQQVGRGVAYGTKYDSHVLNVRAAGMSAFPDESNHFVKWADDRPELFEEEVAPTTFISRRVYGAYLHSVLQTAIKQANGKVALKRWKDEAINLHENNGSLELGLESGENIRIDKAVLAIGHFPPGHPHLGDGSFYSSDRYVADPWTPGHLDALSRDDTVLLIGSGLTALDLALAMRDRGHRGTVHMVSRRGQLPQPHRTNDPYKSYLSHPYPSTTRALVKLVRSELDRARANGIDWRPVLDALRPATQDIWKSLSVREQRRFLSKVRAYWESHRHRMPPQVEALATDMLATGRLVLHAGKVETYEDAPHGVYATMKLRATGECETILVDHVINCTGPECDYRRMRHPLIASLLGQGLIRPDELALGLDTDNRGALLNADGIPSDTIFTLGPLRKGTLWETTAVPEIRTQARDLANHLLTE